MAAVHPRSGLAIATARGDSDLEALIAASARASPQLSPPRLENLRHIVATSETVTFLVARLDGDAVGCAFADPWPHGYARAHVLVLPELRRRGIGSALLAEARSLACAAGRRELLGDVFEQDVDARAYLEHRGFAVVGGERAVTLELAAYRGEPPSAPDGVEIVRLFDRPDLAESLYPIAVEAAEDVPGSDDGLSFGQWRARELDRPTRRRDLFFVAVAGGEAVGYASVDALDGEGRNGLTAVRRTWRRRGVATALKRAQIDAACALGLERLVTASEERNVAMSALNAKLGYLPDTARSTLAMRGPANVRFPS
jgi:GNAT superfamily N-acetyltransferase